MSKTRKRKQFLSIEDLLRPVRPKRKVVRRKQGLMRSRMPEEVFELARLNPHKRRNPTGSQLLTGTGILITLAAVGVGIWLFIKSQKDKT